MACPPTEAHPGLVPFEPSAQRSLPLFGTTVSLALVPGRRARTGRVDSDRPALQRSPADRILREEAIWRSESLVLTPNLYPFAHEQRILWMARPAREPDHGFWLAVIEWVARTDGTALLNNIGAAATIPRAHAHLLSERQPFLLALPERALATDLIDVPDGCELIAKDVPFCLLGVRGRPAAIATALLLLAEARLTAAWNVVLSRDVALGETLTRDDVLLDHSAQVIALREELEAPLRH